LSFWVGLTNLAQRCAEALGRTYNGNFQPADSAGAAMRQICEPYPKTQLHLVFADQKLFKQFVKQIPLVADKYKDVPGFSSRYYPRRFAELMNTLNSLSPKERLAQYNKAYVDKFLNYTFRAILHADEYKARHYIIPERSIIALREFLSYGSWGSASTRLDIWQKFLPNNTIMLTDDGNNGVECIDNAGRLLGILYPENAEAIWANNNTRITKETMKTIFGIERLRDLETTHFLEAVPIFVNGNHYNLAVRKSAAKKFGF